MDTAASIPDPPAPGVPRTAVDWAEIKRFADSLSAIDRSAVPADPLTRAVHLAVAELDRVGVSEPTNERLAELLAALDLALGTLDRTFLDAATAHGLMALLIRVDDAKSLLETPDFGVVATDQLAGRLRELYGGIIRLRGASARLHQAWRHTGTCAGRRS
jgi:hypothetical protein